MFWFQSQQIKRSLSNSENSIYLTFDDGPSEQSTSQVLDVLNKNQIQSTFFVVVENIKKQTSLTREILSSQHSLLSHSTDHTYQHFFSTKKNLKNWVLNSIHELQDFTGQKCWGFRPPAGVITPPLIEIAEEESLPIYLWNHRFFDTQRKWTTEKANQSLKKMKAGDIVLLHDRQKPQKIDTFLQTLEYYIEKIQTRGLKSSCIK